MEPMQCPVPRDHCPAVANSDRFKRRTRDGEVESFFIYDETARVLATKKDNLAAGGNCGRRRTFGPIGRHSFFIAKQDMSEHVGGRRDALGFHKRIARHELHTWSSKTFH